VKPEELAAILAGMMVTAFLMVFLLAALLLSGCASTSAELAARDAELHERLNPCRYIAVEVDSGQVICEPNDCACHAELVKKVLGHGHWVHE
jgi:hypothetical protein